MHTDAPIKEQAEDFLNRTTFSEKLGQSLLDWNQDESTVIGLYGAWGSGKTSIINLAIEYMKQKIKMMDDPEKPIILKFNPWYFSEQEQLISMFFDLLAKEYSHDESIKEAKNIGNKLVSYSKFFQPLSLIPGAEPWATIIKKVLGSAGEALSGLPSQEDKSLNDLKAKITELMLNEGKKVIIFIDDIDRLTRKEIKQIFQLMKISADFPRIIYVAAFSPEDVISALEENGISGASYLEKIVQHQIIVPTIEQKELDRYLYYSDHPIPQNIVEDLRELPIDSSVTLRCAVRSLKDSTAEINGKNENEIIKVKLKEKINFSALGIEEKSQVYIEGLLKRDEGDIFIEVGEKGKFQKYYLSCIDQVFLNVGIDNEIIKKFDEEFTYAYLHYIRKIFINIRQSKRFITSLLFDLPQIKDEVNLFDFVILEILKVFNSGIYFDIPKNWWIYVDNIYEDFISGNPIGKYGGDKENEKIKIIKDHVDSLFKKYKIKKEEQDLYVNLLSLLFPNVSKAYDKSHHFIGSHNRGEKRISTTSFLKYFALKVSAFEIFPDSMIQRIIEEWNGLECSLLAENIDFLISERLKHKNLIPFLDKLSIFIEKITSETSECLIRYFCNNLDSYEFNDPAFSEYAKTRAFIYDLLNTRIEGQRIQPIVIDMINKSSNLLLVAGFLSNRRGPNYPDYNIKRNTNIEKLDEIYSQRIKKQFVDQDADIF